MKRRGVEVRPVRPYERVSFNIYRHGVEQAHITQWAIELALENWTKIDLARQAVPEFDPETIWPHDLESFDPVDRMPHDVDPRRGNVAVR